MWYVLILMRCICFTTKRYNNFDVFFFSILRPSFLFGVSHPFFGSILFCSVFYSILFFSFLFFSLYCTRTGFLITMVNRSCANIEFSCIICVCLDATCNGTRAAWRIFIYIRCKCLCSFVRWCVRVSHICYTIYITRTPYVTYTFGCAHALDMVWCQGDNVPNEREKDKWAEMC